jgi:hypothetical protein
MIYVFTFLGEFGYELFNWQGVVRKFAGSLKADERVVCAGRAGLASWYESAARYADISAEPLFQHSLASGYFAVPPVAAPDQSRVNYGRESKKPRSLIFDLRLRAALRARVEAQLPAAWRGEPLRWIFSSSRTRLRGLTFGARRFWFGRRAGGEGDIYDGLDLNNNQYRRIEADPASRERVMRQLGAALAEPFVLVQTRSRAATIRSAVTLPKEKLIAAVARRRKVILLTFNTGRALDSFSELTAAPNCSVYACRSFPEQAALIAAAQHCLFFTEGDFGSHIYVPPFMGRDVTAVAAREIYQLGTTPVDFWNRAVFQFGGQIRARAAEDVLASPESIELAVDELLAG